MKKIIVLPMLVFGFAFASAQVQSNGITQAPGTTNSNNGTTVAPVQQPVQNTEMRRQSPPPPGTIQQNPHGNAMSPATGVNTLEDNRTNTSQGTTTYRNTGSTMPAANTSNQGGYNAAPGGTATNRTGGRK